MPVDDQLGSLKTNSSLYISRIIVEQLFGQYSYDLHSLDTDFSKLLILYGDNGSGKTTILKCLFHLLSPAKNKSHRSELARVPFRRFSAKLGDDVEVAAERPEGNLVGSFEMRIVRQGQVVASAQFKADPSTLKLVPEKKPNLRRPLLEELASLGLKLHLLSDDRKIVTDLLPSAENDDDEEDELVRHDRWRVADPRYVTLGGAYVTKADASTSLEKALQRLVDWIRKQAITGSGAGEVNANTLYADITKRIISPFRQIPESKPALQQLISELKNQAVRSISFAKFGLSTELPADEFNVTLQDPKAAQQALLLDQILRPFVDGVRLRLDALDSIRDTISTFIETINAFYQGKIISFHLREGVTIRMPMGGSLHPNLLSSGEKQLLLLLCNVLAAGDEASIFIIDEPELSLNVKWQRKLVDALLECTKKSQTQFVLATHSLELLTQHQHNVLRLSA
jgi:energy-coupling factor transporter ATP-binding protein EcfA2